MVKPNPVHEADNLIDPAAVLHAADVASQLAHGGPAADASVAHARAVLFYSLWEGGQRATGVLHRGLSEMYVGASSAEDQAELIGEFVAAGDLSTIIMNQIAQTHDAQEVAEFLSASDMDTLSASLEKSVYERLATILSLFSEHGHSNGDPIPIHYAEDDHLAVTRQRFSGGGARSDEKNINGDGGDGDIPAPDISLRDTSIPEEIRFSVALARGEVAIPELADMLCSDLVNREFACETLIALGNEGGEARTVYNHVRLLDVDPDAREAARFVRDGVSSHDLETPGNLRARQHAGSGAIGDGWLHRALEACDVPSVLRASAGRELVAIPLAVRQLVRERRKNGQRTQ